MFNLVPVKKSNNYNSLSNSLFHFDDLVSEFFNPTRSSLLSENSVSKAMKIDIKDTPSSYVFEAELPGVEKDQINIELKDQYLTISVEKSNESNEENSNYIRKERSFSSMSRSFYIENIQADNIEASYKDGILSITVPKLQIEEPAAKKIQIN